MEEEKYSVFVSRSYLQFAQPTPHQKISCTSNPDKMDQRSLSSRRTRSRTSSSTASCKALAELEMARANLRYTEKINRLKAAQAMLEAEREVAIKEAAVRALGGSGRASTRGSSHASIITDQEPVDPIQRTQEYVDNLVVGLQGPPQQLPSPSNPPLEQLTNEFSQPPKKERPDSFAISANAHQSNAPEGKVNQEYHNVSTGDIMRHFAMREHVRSSMVRFSDQAKDYRAWKRSFLNSFNDMLPTPSEEMDLLVKWLGPTSIEHAKRLRNAHINHPHKGLQEIWRRLDKMYGSPEAIEDSLFEKIHMFPRINRDYHRLRELSDLLTELQAAKDDGDLPGLGLLDTARGLKPIVEKLPVNLREQWIAHGTAYKRRHQVPFPPFAVFATFIQQQADDRNDPGFCFGNEPQTTGRLDGPSKGRNQVSTNKTQVTPQTVRETCPIHNLPHPLRVCRAFKGKPAVERLTFLEQNQLCYKCCSPDHQRRDCTFEARCAECGSEEHCTALHPAPTCDPTQVKAMPSHGGENHNIVTHCTQVCGSHLSNVSCSKICLVSVHPKGKEHQAVRLYAVLDEHSNRSLAHPEFFDLFNDHGPMSPYSLKTCAGVVEKYGRRTQGYQIKSIDGSVSLPLPTLIECGDIPRNRSEIPTPEAARHHQHLSGIVNKIPELDRGASILLLLGRDIIDVHKVRTQLNGPRNAPYAQRLDMGWVIVGNVCLGESHKPNVVNTFFTKTHETGRPTNFGACPNVFVSKEMSPRPKLGSSVFQLTKEDECLAHSVEDRIFLDIMEREVKKDRSRSWIAPLPFKPSRNRLPNNRHQAVKRLGSLHNQFKKRPQLERDFFAFMKGILDNDQAEIAPPLQKDEERWYLPTFGIYHPKKPNKIRVVFDSSAQYGGMSLNNTLLTGPDLNNNLIGVLLRFRTEAVAVMADIQQMFFCFLVKKEHRNFLRFLWHKDNDPNKEIIEYRMKVHVFGNSPSPAVATYCLRKSVESENPECHPTVVHYVQRDFYVDDGLKSVPTTTEAIALLKETRQVLASSNLKLHKIASNKKEVLDAFPSEDLATGTRDLDLDEDALLTQRSLGLDWNPKGDYFSFNIAQIKKPYTRRGVLSTINGLYDPLGFAAPVIIQGKSILRELTADKFDWDDPLPPKKEQLWTTWRDSLQKLRELQIPRTYTLRSPTRASCRQLCIFSDASIKAIAAVGYLRIIHPDDTCEVGFVMGKTKLAPQTETSVPRLELCAAVLAAELAEMICAELNIQIDSTIFFTDSRVVLGYISNEQRRFYVYVSNRVQRIRRSSHPRQWHYISSEKNPADCGTRSVPTNQLATAPWLSGPLFLAKPSFKTSNIEPHPLIEPENDIDVRPVVTSFATHLSPVLLGAHRFARFSTWKSLRQAIGRLIHVAQSSRKTPRSDLCKGRHYCQTPLSVETLTQASAIILRSAQRDTYTTEISCLKEHNKIPGTSTIVKLDPFLDELGLLRVGGRSRKAGLEHSEKHPFILSSKHHVATLIIRHQHELTHHQGRHFTEGAVRSAGFWIVGGKKCISRVIHHCVPCRKIRGPVQVQKMADLPEDRLSCEPPFTNVGLDVFGPWPIVSRRTRGGLAHSKRWAALFTCMTTRGVHIEVLESWDTSSMINALRRFFSIRGPVKIIRSDQGTNFTGARRELEISPTLDIEAVNRHLTNHGCTWLFNPPHAPHMGGVWERMIGISKRILDSMLLQHGSTKLTHEVLTTFLAEVAAIINNRPLIPVSSDPEDPVPLTPSTLLTQKIGPLPAPPGQFDVKDVSRKQWKHVQHLAMTFWNRWKGQYLPLLQCRSKWTDDRPNLKPGSVVLLKDHEAKRNDWPLGIITRVIPSSDGKVRQVEVKVNKNNFNRLFLRPVTETVLLLPPSTSDHAL